jgi:nitrite reductase/ring-hydroxylating ferredoxin subunit
MSSAKHEVYVICAASSIAPGEAKAFSLAKAEEAGEGRPFSIVIVRKNGSEFFGYMNVCPHQGVWLNVGDGSFLDVEGRYFQCGRHGAKFEIESGLCVEGACKEAALEPVAVAVIGGDLCLCGVPLVEDDGWPDPFADVDDTMEIMIHPD